jgi:acyl-CoA thioester hydrolase
MSSESECGYRDKPEGCQVEMAALGELPLYHRQTIPKEYLDAMGHMNVRWYMALFDEASWRFFAALGMDEEYYRERRLGGFALKHHIQYLAEVREGQTVSVRTRLLDRSAKRIHFMHFLINETAGNLAATLESLGTHADMRRRRSAPVPEDVAAKIDAILAHHRRLAWQAPVCGVIRV